MILFASTSRFAGSAGIEYETTRMAYVRHVERWVIELQSWEPTLKIESKNGI